MQSAEVPAVVSRPYLRPAARPHRSGQVDVLPVTAADSALPPPAEGSAQVAARVAQARDLAEIRAAQQGLGAGARLNALLSGEAFDRIAAPDDAGKALLNRAAEHGSLTARGWTRTR